jgi:Ala-tRNA(Pro) deacylase
VIQPRIERYLRDASIPFRWLPHPRAATAQETAEVEHVSGWRVAKSIAVELASGDEIVCVVPAPTLVDLDAVCDATGSSDARLVEEARLRELFPGCEPGAAPPFGGLWNLPVVLDPSPRKFDRILVVGGTHERLLEIPMQDYLTYEQPLVAPIAVMPGEPWRHAEPMPAPEPHPWHRP